jgi:uncharacterized membrane protein
MFLKIVRLWPELLLAAVTAVLVLADGLRSSAGDPGFYWGIAGKVAEGQIPWRDFPYEYPPVSLIPVLLPYFLPGGEAWPVFNRYLFTENVLMMAAIGAGVLWLARRGWAMESTLRTSVLYVALTLTLAPSVVWRYEPLPVLLTVVAVMLAATYRSSLSGVALGTAVITKLYPLAMLPVLALGQIRDRLRPALLLGVATVVTTVLIAAPFVLIAGGAAFSYLEYSITRGVQIESVPGALAILANVLGGPNARIFHGFGTFQVDSPLIPLLGFVWTALSGLIVLGLGVAILVRFRADRRTSGSPAERSQVTYLIAALLVALVSSRILSPQYLFWAVPFVALADRPKTLLYWAACLLTTFVYPLNYQQMLNQEAYAVVATNVRNLILVLFLGAVIAPELRFAFNEFSKHRNALTPVDQPDRASA